MLPWAEMMRAALAMGLGPERFWALSLREWLWLADTGAPAIGRPALDSLMAAFPDRRR
ncbi:phage tail assembly chaperone [Henriciella aquimarina]|uniref:phage tail assembly chaperone n=1 Tax=Henriciella aquimarina TaxID=545261 RepID=UPI000A028651|nr:phage tail assembly chaperone [Henriciella aquimarina]